ncbi:MAG: hypothetical protein ACP5IL_13130 [Syntrophobacteraceae bacterium]
MLAELILPSQTRVTIPYAHAMKFVSLFLLLPLLAGLALNSCARRLANGLVKPVLLLSNLCFIGTIVLTMAVRSGATRSIGWAGLTAMVVLVLASMAIGWLLGGPNRGDRSVSAIATSMRNVGGCLLISAASFPNRAVETALVAFMALMVPPNMLLTLYLSLKEKRAPS